MKRKILVMLVGLVVSATIKSNDYVVRGTVSADDGDVMPFAYVRVNGKMYATQADRNGIYTLTLPEGHYTITADMLGYKQDAKDVTVTGETKVDFVLNEDLINLSTITVTGTRTPRILSESPVVTQIITADDIKKLDATNIQDILAQELPGLEFSFQMNQQVYLSMQGLGGMAILLLVDGERLSGETLDNTDFQRLTANDIERVEVIKGAASALYGSNSVGAVINIITKKAQQGWSTNVNTHWSAHGEQRHGGSVGVAYGKWNSLTNVQYNAIDTYEIHDTEGDGSTTIYGNNQWNVKEKLQYQANENNLITARAGYYFHERYYTEYSNNRARDYSGSVRWESNLTPKGKLDVSYTFDRYDKSDYYTDLHLDFLNYKNLQNTVRALYTHELGHGVTLLAGGDVMSDYLMSYQFEDNGSHSQVNSDIFAQAEWKLNDHWNFLGALRGDWITHTPFNVSPKVAAMYSIKHFSLRGSYSRGFRAPTLKEKYMNFDMGNIFMIYGNDKLTSEHSHSFSLSGEYAYRRYCITATGYFNIMRNEITTLWDKNLPSALSNGSMVYQNVQGRNLAGADVTLAARYPCGVGGKVSYAYFHEFPRKGEYNLSDSRPHSLTMKVDYRKAFKDYEFDIIFSGRVLSKVDYYTYSSDYSTTDVPAHSPAYSIWKLALSQRICRAFNLMLAADNLFNYRSKVFEYNSPVTTGTTLSLTFSVDIDQIGDRWGKKK